MTRETSSIDDLLTGASSPSMPETPEASYVEEAEVVEDVPRESIDPKPQEAPEAPEAPVEAALDDYGNEKAPSKTYTQEEADEYANRIVRERLARLERNNPQLTQQQQAQVQQQAKQGFEYDADSSQDWQQQLESFVRQVHAKTVQEERAQASAAREQQAMAEFEGKFQQGMSKFSDFKEVVGKHSISDAMTMASRSMSDPAAFFYAAAKRAPQDLNRISSLADPYAQMVELGKLEERMRQTKPTTKAPKPISRSREDARMPYTDSREPSIEELIAKDASKRLAKANRFKQK